MHAEYESGRFYLAQMNSLGDMMPSFFLFSFVNCLHFDCKVCQGTSTRGCGDVDYSFNLPFSPCCDDRCIVVDYPYKLGQDKYNSQEP